MLRVEPALLAAAAALNAAITETAVVHVVGEYAAAICEAEYVSIGQWQGTQISFDWLDRNGAWHQAGYHPPPSSSIIERVLTTRAPYRSNDLAADPTSDHTTDQHWGFHTQLTVPLIGGDGDALGVVTLNNKRGGRPFTAQDEQRVVALATQAAIALERCRSRSDLVRTLAALQESEERFRALVQSTSDIIAVVDSGGIVRYLNPAVERILGYTPADLIDADVFAFIHPDDASRVGEALRRRTANPDGPPVPVTFRLRHRDGSWRHLEAMTTDSILQPDFTGFVIDVRDITERTRLEEELRYQAFHDPLTGLTNRALFLDRLGHVLASTEQRGSHTAVLLLDLDHFKLVNDSYGHRAGDQLLVGVAQRLAASVRPGGTVARFGGDEFAILLEDVGEAAAAVVVAERILDALCPPFPVDTLEVYVTASVGVVMRAGAESTPETLLRDADIALYRAKGSGKARAVLFDPAMSAAVVARQAFTNDLRRAVANGELRLHYQPEVDLTNGTIIGMEALVRWQHPERGLVAPKDFIALAADTGMILPIGEWVLREACQQAATWQALRPDGSPLLVGVNICARELAQPTFAAQVRRVLEETGLSPTCLRLEVTETAVMEDIEVASAVLTAVKALGVQIALDDFGTGYSSLSYLRRLPVDVVKIDQSFVRELDQDGPTTAIVQAVVTLGHALGMLVTAEGIETADQLARTRTLTCDMGQGYYFAEPLTADVLVAFLSTGPVIDRFLIPPSVTD